MTDHADTLRHREPELLKLARKAMRNDPEGPSGDLARSWAALVAERDKLREHFEAEMRVSDSLQNYLDATKFELVAAEDEIQRLRDALADLLLRAENVDVPLTRERVSDIARAALAREEDTPKRKLKATGDESWEIVNSGAEEWLAREEDTQ